MDSRINIPILHVDNDENDRIFVRRALAKYSSPFYNFHLTQTETGDQFVKTYQDMRSPLSTTVPVLVCDFDLTNSVVTSYLERVRLYEWEQRVPPAPAIVFSGRSLEQVAHLIAPLGSPHFQDHVRKTYLCEGLVEKIVIQALSANFQYMTLGSYRARTSFPIF